MPRHQQQVVALTYSRDGRHLWIKRTRMDPAPVFDVFVDGEVRAR